MYKTIYTRTGVACLVGLDIWEGNVDFEPAEWERAGIAYVIMRINSMAGGTHKDDLFDTFWAKCANRSFMRGIYFVVTPYETAIQQHSWIKANWPTDAKRTVFLDVEVRQPGRDPADYASMLQSLINLLMLDGWQVHIYTGAGYTEMLSPWPITRKYWWSAYPYSIRPSTAAYTVTWDYLWLKLAELSWPPYNKSACPGEIIMWQVTDTTIVPGCPGHTMDVNLFAGTEETLRTAFGYEGDIPVPPSNLGTYKATGLYAYVRPGGPSETYKATGKLVKDQKVNVTKLNTDGTWAWCEPIPPDTFSPENTPGWVNMLGLIKVDDVIPPTPPPDELTYEQKVDILWREAGLHGWNLNP